MSNSTGCTFTCGGQCVTKLDDVVSFIEKLKDLDLNNEKKCCSDGTQVGTNCKCADEKDLSKVCLWDTCMTLPDLKSWVAQIQARWKENTPAPWAIISILWAYLASGQGKLTDALPLFMSNTGGLVGVVSGLLGASYAGIKTAKAAVRYGFFGDSGKNLFFYEYGGQSWEGNAFGFIAALWSVVFMIEIAALALIPFELMYAMDKSWRKADAAKKDQLNLHYMTMGVIEAIGLWASAAMLGDSADAILGFYDNTSGDKVKKFKETFGDVALFTNSNASFIDIVQHTFLALGTVLISTVASGAIYWYVYNQVVGGDELPSSL